MSFARNPRPLPEIFAMTASMPSADVPDMRPMMRWGRVFATPARVVEALRPNKRVMHRHNYVASGRGKSLNKLGALGTNIESLAKSVSASSISRLRGLLRKNFFIAAILCTAVAGAGAGQNKVDFNREIRPILSDNCYACHGPDAGKRKAGLRLDLKEGAFAKLKSDNFAIVPKHPEKSALVERITAKDEDERMPPLKTGKKLSAAQIGLLRRWIAEGAEWKTHWSFIRPERPEIPEVRSQRSEVRNQIDNFIRARLEKERLKP